MISEAQMKKAIKAVKAGRTYSAAPEEFGVNHSTLYSQLNNAAPLVASVRQSLQTRRHL